MKTLHSIITYEKEQIIPYGYCHCGCGQKTPIAAVNNKSKGMVKGEPSKCITGHHPPKRFVETFWSKIDKSNGEDACWNWVAYCDPKGYGRMTWSNREGGWNFFTHRIAYELIKGAIPAGLNVLHKCDNPKCANPKHLFLGTQKDNIQDMISKGRRRSADTVAKGENNPNHKLTEAIVIAIRERYKGGDVSFGQIARDLKLDRSTVSDAIQHKTWRHVK